MSKIYLASKSPRRQELLTLMRVPFDVLLIDVPEEVRDNETPEDYSRRVTLDKLHEAWKYLSESRLELRPILTADTEVIVDAKIYGKPNDEAHAFEMLKSLSGRTHEVMTSVGVQYKAFEKVLVNRTKVTFANLSDEDIKTYLSCEKYLDKAGAYGIQSSIGQFIKNINGCFFSVMGLPLNDVRELLQQVEQFIVNESH